MDKREAFEKWAEKQGLNLFRDNPIIDGKPFILTDDYADAITTAYWHCFQAAWDAAPKAEGEK